MCAAGGDPQRPAHFANCSTDARPSPAGSIRARSRLPERDRSQLDERRQAIYNSSTEDDKEPRNLPMPDKQAPTKRTDAVQRIAAFTMFAFVAMVMAVGIALFAVSFAPHRVIEPRMARVMAVSAAKAAEPRFQARLAATISRLRLAGVVIAVIGFVLLLLRRRVASAFAALLTSGGDFFRVVGAALRAGARDDGAPNLVALAVICVIGFAIRLRFLFQPMRYDEAFTYVRYASKPLYRGLSDYSFPNNHIFHTLLVHISTGIF